MSDQREYVVGFYFFRDMSKVLLIRKNRPEWQRGLLNGIGGKVELRETYREAMIREFREETHMDTSIKDWYEVGVLTFPEVILNVFTYYSSKEAPRIFESPTDEQLELFNVMELQSRNDIIPNLRSLLPLCLDRIRFGEG